MGLAFKAWLAVNRVRQLDIAELLQVTPQTVCKKVNGLSNFTVSDVKKICEHYGVSSDIFFD